MGGGSSTIQDPEMQEKLKHQAEEKMKVGHLTREDFAYLANPQPMVWSDILFKVLKETPDSEDIKTEDGRTWLEAALNQKYSDAAWHDKMSDPETDELPERMTQDEFQALAVAGCSGGGGGGGRGGDGANAAQQSLRRRISVKCAKPGNAGITVKQLVEEENAEGEMEVDDEDVEDALAYVNGTNGRSRPSMVKKPMSKETVAKVHVELLKTMEFKEAFKLYDSDNDGKADAHDVYRVMVGQGEDVTFEQAQALMATIVEPGQAHFDFRGFCRMMREEGAEDDAESKANSEAADAPASAPEQ